MSNTTISVAILAGGLSRRMGQDKTMMPFRGEPLLQRVARRVQSLTDDLIIVTNATGVLNGLTVRARVVPDFGEPGRGPLAGFASALREARHELVVLVAADMPFLNPAALGHLVDLASGFDAVVPVTDEGYPEPLHAVYRTSCLHAVIRRLENGDRKLASFFPDVQLNFVPTHELEALDPGLRSFINVNTPHDWHAVAPRAGSQ